MKTAAVENIVLGGRSIDYRVVDSRAAQKLRIRIGLDGVKIIKPEKRHATEARDFLRRNADWVNREIDRVKELLKIRKEMPLRKGQILFNGNWVSVITYDQPKLSRENQVQWEGGGIAIYRSQLSRTAIAKSLEYWLRKQAKTEIEKEIESVASKIKRRPNKLYIMDQRTKWGNCSALHNLSFSWRLIMMPELVRRYLIIHECVHLAILNHSTRYWLVVKSLIPECDKAKNWLKNNSQSVLIDLRKVI